MRLLHVETRRIHEFPGDVEDRGYAILSHTWGEEECTLQHMSSPGVEKLKGYAKIKLCCEQAIKDGFKWVWIDTYVPEE